MWLCVVRGRHILRSGQGEIRYSMAISVCLIGEPASFQWSLLSMPASLKMSLNNASLSDGNRSSGLAVGIAEVAVAPPLVFYRQRLVSCGDVAEPLLVRRPCQDGAPLRACGTSTLRVSKTCNGCHRKMRANAEQGHMGASEASRHSCRRAPTQAHVHWGL